MKNERKLYKIEIFGEQYSLVSDELEQHILRAAESVDQLMQQIAQGASHPDAKKVAVLSALQLASQLIKKTEMVDLAEDRALLLSDQIDKTLTALSS